MTLRIVWASDSPWASSGYSVETRLTVPRLAALGHDMAYLATYGLQGAPIEWNGIRVYPGGADPFANDVMRAAAQDWRADIVITLKDSIVFNPQAFEGLRWVPLTPVDHEPCPPVVSERLRFAYRPIAYALNGFAQLRAAGLDPLYCPHAYDPAIFNPQPKEEARKFLGIPDDLFIVGTVAVNRGGIPSRKAWPQNLEGFALFAKDKPNVRYFLHTYLGQDGFEGSINLPALCAQLGILDKVIFCDQERYKAGYPDGYMNAFYNAIDVLNAVSLGEGFGIPQLEAQATGCLVITSDFAASRDLCFAGWKVSDGLRFYDGQGAWVFLPQPSAIAGRLELAYRDLYLPQPKEHYYNGVLLPKGDTEFDTRTYYRDRALAGAAEYQIDHVIERYWKPALEELERSIANEGSRGVLRIIRPEEVLA